MITALKDLAIVMIWFIVICIVCLGAAVIHGTVQYFNNPDNKKGTK